VEGRRGGVAHADEHGELPRCPASYRISRARKHLPNHPRIRRARPRRHVAIETLICTLVCNPCYVVDLLTKPLRAVVSIESTDAGLI
jgi:hypothetical protein